MGLKAVFSGAALLVVGMVSSMALQAADLPWTFQPLPAVAEAPKDNPSTKEKLALGKQLFFDARLSITGTHSCNSCHNLLAGGEDGRAQPMGVYGRMGKRSTQTIWNAAFHTVYTWDGSANTLEEQAQKHILDPNIMGMPDADVVVGRINAIPGYRQQFEKVFGKEAVSFKTIAMALSSYERTLTTPNSPFDRYLRGDDKAISVAAKRGIQEFIDVRCASCHFWINLAGPIPGLAFQQGEGFYELFPNYPDTDYESRYHLADDLGRVYFSQEETDTRMWRMPSLRNIAITAPYFHNGAVKTLDEAVRVMAKTQLRRAVTEQQVSDIVAFLNTLTGEFPEQTLPRLPETPNRTAVAGHDH